MGQHPPLRAGQPKLAHRAVEHRAHQPGDVVDQEADIAVRALAHLGLVAHAGFLGFERLLLSMQH